VKMRLFNNDLFLLIGPPIGQEKRLGFAKTTRNAANFRLGLFLVNVRFIFEGDHGQKSYYPFETNMKGRTQEDDFSPRLPSTCAVPCRASSGCGP
jgi:hypothetical protein